jgi:hypothetical protein
LERLISGKCKDELFARARPPVETISGPECFSLNNALSLSHTHTQLKKQKPCAPSFSTWEAHAYIIMVHGRGNLVDAALVTERRNPRAAAARVPTAVASRAKAVARKEKKNEAGKLYPA